MERQVEPVEDFDILYSQYLENLKNVILKVSSTEDVNYCKRWIEAFNNCQNDQKIARNCLVSLMYQQLEQEGRLSEPFIDLSKIYRDFNNIFIDEDMEELLSNIKSPCDFAGDTMESSTECLSADNRSHNNFDEDPRTNRHLAQINDLTKFIVDMKNVNDTLQNELHHVREQNSFLKMKIDMKDVEMEKLLCLARSQSKVSPTMSNAATLNVFDSGKIPLSNKINSIIESYDAQKTNLKLPSFRTVADDRDQTNSMQSPTTSEISVLSETKLFELLDYIASTLDEYSNSFFETNRVTDAIENFNFFPGRFKRKDLELRVQAFQKRFQQSLVVALNNFRSHSMAEVRQMNIQDAAVQTDIEKYNIEKITATKTTETESFCFKGKTDDEIQTRESLKIDVLRSCVIRLKRSRDKLAAKYERKMEEKSVQELIQRNLWNLQIASIRSHLQMNVVCKSQTQLCEITEALESKYKSIISETFDKVLTGNLG